MCPRSGNSTDAGAGEPNKDLSGSHSLPLSSIKVQILAFTSTPTAATATIKNKKRKKDSEEQKNMLCAAIDRATVATRKKKYSEEKKNAMY